MGTRHSTTGGQHSFAQIPSANISRSSFDRSCGLKTTFDAGLLIPIFVDEALPGDTMSLTSSHFARLATPLHPIMDNMWLDTHFFAVPIRLIWSNWQKFNGEQTNPGDSTDFLVPTITQSFPGAEIGSVYDYMGIPTGIEGVEHSALWLRAMNLIWNEWFRDENLQDSVPNPTGDGPDSPTTYELLRRGKRHDYFSSSLPFPQKGPSVSLPLGDTAPTTLNNNNVEGFGIPTFSFNNESNVSLGSGDSPNQDDAQWNQNIVQANDLANWDNTFLRLEDGTGVADLTEATSATINQIREAFQIQRLFERDARGGSRYTEIIRSHFGVVSPDQRLQRPEYLGGGTSRVGIQTVPQTTPETGGSTPQGNLAGYGTSTGTIHGFNKSFVEHCVILGFISARADLNYQQGLDRMWSRRTRFDFYWPAFQGLGEQSVLNKEIFSQGVPGGDADDEVFGYQERYAEYRYKPSKITGLMRSVASETLDTWHLAQDFADLPVLGADFIEENPPIDRIIAVPTEPHFILDMYFKFRCARPMPMFGVPGGIDRF